MVLRYFENKSAPEIAVALNIGEEAAKKRLSRALEKLRRDFFRRGVNVSTAALGAAVLTQFIQPAPAMLAKTVAGAAISKGAAASASTLTLVKGALRIMAWTKTKLAVAAGVVAILAASTTTVVVIGKYHSRGDSSVSISVLYSTNAPNDRSGTVFYVFSIVNRDRKPVRIRGFFSEAEGNPLLLAPTMNPGLPWAGTAEILQPGQISHQSRGSTDG